MDGVTILNQHADWSTAIFILTILFLLAILSFVYMIGYFCDGEIALAGGYLIASVLLIALFVGFILAPKPIIYSVTLDDSVKISEFNAHYEIISSDGNLLTVKERKEN